MDNDQAKKDFAKIVDKARKLKELADNNPNENEAISAANKLHEMLAAHNLSLDDIVKTQQPDIVADNDLLMWRAGWVKLLLHETAKLYFCGYFYTTFPAAWIKFKGLDKLSRKLIAGSPSREYVRHTFVGTQANIVVAKHVAEYLISTAEALCREAVKKYPANERISARHSFMNAISARLCARLRERRLEAANNGVKSESSNLPALRPLYEQTAQDYKDWKNENDMKTREKTSVMKIHHNGGARDGDAAGKNIGLDAQVANVKPTIQIGRVT